MKPLDWSFEHRFWNTQAISLLTISTSMLPISCLSLLCHLTVIHSKIVTFPHGFSLSIAFLLSFRILESSLSLLSLLYFIPQASLFSLLQILHFVSLLFVIIKYLMRFLALGKLVITVTHLQVRFFEVALDLNAGPLILVKFEEYDKII